MNYIFVKLNVENPELRTECLKWIWENVESVPLAETKDMVIPLIACLSDKSKAIRDQTERIIEIVMPITGYSEF